ncbi:MAG: matrixin family metalloprotease [Verrucomicrobiota bacterium]|nr:matrixin family metalloprotease [Verrucomicrobiota bacterium]
MKRQNRTTKKQLWLLAAMAALCGALPSTAPAYDLYIGPIPDGGARGIIMQPVVTATSTIITTTAVQVTVAAQGANGYTFDHWVVMDYGTGMGLNSTTSNPAYLRGPASSGNVFVDACFRPEHRVTLAVSGDGSTTPAPGVYDYTNGQVVAFMAARTGNNYFHYWTIDAVFYSQNESISITVTNDFALTAVFKVENPDDFDGDNDGMPDSWEIRYGLNPAIFGAYDDPDNDGLPNLLEYHFSTTLVHYVSSPIHADSDGDGMDDGYEYYHIGIPGARGVVGLASNMLAIVRAGGEYGPNGNPDADYIWNTLTGYETGIGLSNIKEYNGPDLVAPGTWPPVVVPNVTMLVNRYEPSPSDSGDQSYSDTTDSEDDGFDDGYEYSWDIWQGGHEGAQVGDPLGHLVPYRFGMAALPSSVVIGDWNLDATQDVAVANFGQDNVTILFGIGRGRFGGPALTNTLPVGAGPCALVRSDINGDGFMDLVTANRNTNSISILYGLGDGRFLSAVNYTVGTYVAGDNASCVAAADFNGGGVDIAVAHQGNDCVYILSAPAFTVTQTIPLGAGARPSYIATGAIWGGADLVTANWGANTVSVLRNSGGVFSVFTNLAAAGQPSCALLADFTHDTINDVVVSCFGGRAVYGWKGLGAGAFAAPIVTSLGGASSPRHMAMGQFEGDVNWPARNDSPDVAVANEIYSTASILLGSAFDMSFGQDSEVAAEQGPYWIAAGDLNADNLDDLAVVNRNSDSMQVFFGIGNGRFGAGVSYAASARIVDRRFNPAVAHALPPDNGKPDYDFIYNKDTAFVGSWLTDEMEYMAWTTAATNVSWAGTNGLLRPEFPNRRRCTHPFLWDCDKDFLPDGWELAFGYDPWDINTDDNDRNDGQENPDGDWYALGPGGTNHNSLYLAIGFDPRTAYGCLNRQELVTSANNEEFSNYQELIGPRGFAAIMPNDPDDRCTHPFRNDTDGDGIWDGWEWYVGLNAKNSSDGPLDRDTGGGDGLTNFEEFQSYYTSTNVWGNWSILTNWANKLRPCDPFDRDTDADQAPDGSERDAFNFSGGMGVLRQISGEDFYYTGGGLNPCTVDTDMDYLPDYWEASFAGAVGTNADGNLTCTNSGMDGTEVDYLMDPDRDGLRNYQEYLAGATYHWQWSYNNPFQLTNGWRSFYQIDMVQGRYNPWDFFDVRMSATPARPYGDAMLGPGGREPKRWDPRFWAALRVPPVPYRFITAGEPMGPPLAIGGAVLYSTCFPNTRDTDGDGMDDYFEIYHMMNPIGGVMFDRVLDKIRGSPDLPLGPPGGGEDLEFAPWMNGWHHLDWDQDGLPNIYESVQPLAPDPQFYHTDPSPYWLSDISHVKSWASMYYWLGPEMGSLGYWYWNPLVLMRGPNVPFTPPAYFFDFEMHEGFDTDNDGIADRAELVDTTAGPGSTDPLTGEDPIKRRALRLNGQAAARTQGQGYVHDPWTAFREFAAEVWVRADNPQAGRDQVVVERPALVPIGNPMSLTPGLRLNFRIAVDSNGCPYVGYHGSGTDAVFEEARAPVAQRLIADQWYHLAGVYDGQANELRLYVNGRLAAMKPTAEIPHNGWYGGEFGNPDIPQAYIWSFMPIIVGACERNPGGWIGGVPMSFSPWMYNRGIPCPWPGIYPGHSPPDLGLFFAGYVDEVRVWNGRRTQAEIRGNMNRTFRRVDVMAANLAARQSGGSELLYCYGFDDLPDVDYAGPAPEGFNLLTGYPHDGSYMYTPWWATAPDVSMVYNDYKYVPWLENVAGHLPLDPPADTTLVWSNRYPNTLNPYVYVYGHATEGFFEQHPFYYSPLERDMLPLRWAVAEEDVAMWDKGGVPARDPYDSDGDTLPDDWEIAHGLDPLVATGADGADGDPDGDGLSNIYEYLTGNDPHSGDSDGDSIPDRDEDYDGDGLSNRAELNIGTMPHRVDTDDDGVTDWEETTGSTDSRYNAIRPNTSLPPSGMTDPLDALSPFMQRSMYFNGNARLIVPPSNKLMAKDWSLEMWVRPITNGDGGVLVCRYITAPVPGEFGVNYELGLSTNSPAGAVRPYVQYVANDGATVRVDGTGPTEVTAQLHRVTIPLDTWSHLAATYDSVAYRLSLYVDGELAAYRTDATVTPPTVFGYFTDHTADEVTIGAYRSIGAITNAYEGYIDEVRIWRGVRSAADIQARYNAPEVVPGGLRGGDLVALRNRAWVPNEGLSAAVMSLPENQAARVLVQFRAEPPTQGILALERAGARIMNYVSRSVRLVSATPAQLRAARDGIRWADAPAASDKISADLCVDGSHAARKVLVQFFDDAPLADALAAISSVGANIVGERKYLASTYMVVEADDAKLAALAGSDATAWIMRCPNRLPFGSPAHVCSGPMVQGLKLAPFAVVGDGWDGPGRGSADLLYCFMNVTPDLPETAARQAVIDSMKKWAFEAALSFTETPAQGRNNSIDIGWYAGDHGDGDPFDGPFGVLAHAFLPNDVNPEPIAGDVHFDEDETWRVGVGAGISLPCVSLHELGHSLGMDHSTDPDAIMFPFYQDVADPQLTQDDIDGIQSIYGSPVGRGVSTSFRFDDGGTTAEDFGEPQDWLNDWASAAVLDGCAFATNQFAPLDKDSDGDGMPDLWEMAHGLDPYGATSPNGAWGDPDRDGLNNISEYWAGTDPMDSDSDNDGFGDYDSRSSPNARTWGEMYDDGDGIPDEWEMLYPGPAPTTGKRGLDPAYYDAHLDPDEDGWSNYAEYMGSYLDATRNLVRSSDPLNPANYPEPLLTLHARYHGARGNMIEDVLAQGAQIHIDFYTTAAMDGFPVGALNMTTASSQTRALTTGHLVEGTNYLFCYLDLDVNGQWDPINEPAGIPTEQPLIGWDDSNDIEIGLTDSQPARPRFGWGAVTTAVYRIEIKQGATTVFTRLMNAPRNYVHEGDYLYAGLSALASNNNAYTCLIYTNADFYGHKEWLYYTYAIKFVETPPLSRPSLYGHDWTYPYARNVMEWTMDANSTRYSMDIAALTNGPILMTVADRPAPYRNRHGNYATEIPSANPAGLFYAGDTYTLGANWANGRYWMRIRSGAGSNRVSINSAWRAFNLGLAPPAGAGKSMIDGDVRYFGKVSRGYGDPQSNLVIVVQSFMSQGFSGNPDGQVQIVYVCDPNSPSPLKGSYRIMGLHNGRHYVRAFIDMNANRKLDRFEPYGFAKDSVTDTDYVPRMVNLSGQGGVAATDIDIVIRDRDTDDDQLPDGWEWQYFGTLAYGAHDDPDNDLADNLQEYMDTLYDSDPSDPDTDDDGLLDGQELALGLSTHNPDTDRDGVSDGIEVLRTKTDPLDAADYLNINAVEMLAVPFDGVSFTLRWVGKDGVLYGVQYSDDLSSWQSVTNIWTGAGVHEYRDPQSPTCPKRYYRVIVPW